MADYSLLELASRLAADPGEKALYQTDPPGYLGARGYGELSPTELHDALGHVADSVPPELAAVIDPSAGLDQLAATDLAELGISELHGVPVEPAELPAADDAPVEVDGFDGDPGDLDDLGGALRPAGSEGQPDPGTGSDGDGDGDGEAEGGTPPTGVAHAAEARPATLDDLDDLDDLGRAATPHGDPFTGGDDPFGPLDDEAPFDTDDSALQGFGPAEAELADDAPEGGDALWEDFDV